MILWRNRGQDLCVQESHSARKGLSRNINLGNLSTRRLRPLLIKSLGIFNLHPNVSFLLLPHQTSLFLVPLVDPLSTVPFSKAYIWMPWGWPYLWLHPLSLNLLTHTHIPSDFCPRQKKQARQRKVYFWQTQLYRRGPDNVYLLDWILVDCITVFYNANAYFIQNWIHPAYILYSCILDTMGNPTSCMLGNLYLLYSINLFFAITPCS
jgi:hypothetical protein